VMLELAGGQESALSHQLAWRRLGVKGLDSYRHPEVGSERDGLASIHRSIGGGQGVDMRKVPSELG